MKIYLTRHGQTELNRKKLMQGRTDEPLNETGRAQAREAREKLGNISFDAVYASTLDRAVETASVIGNVPREKVLQDPRILETDFGNHELCRYGHLGLRMTLYWALPEIFPAPPTVETIPEMKARTNAFLDDLAKNAKEQGCENVLIVCHGGIMRVLSGALEHRKNGLKWRPKPRNCEIRIYEA